MIVAVTHLCQVSVDDAVMLAQIDNLHSCSIFISRYILKLACLLLKFLQRYDLMRKLQNVFLFFFGEHQKPPSSLYIYGVYSLLYMAYILLLYIIGGKQSTYRSRLAGIFAKSTWQIIDEIFGFYIL